MHRKAVSPTRRAGQHRRRWRRWSASAPAQILDSPADRRGVRLGRPGVEGADGDDAGHAVRLPVRGAPQADLLVGHDHQPAGPRAGEELGAQGARRSIECFGAFNGLWNERVNAEPAIDLISMLAHGPATRDMDRCEYYQGNVVPADHRRQRHHPEHHLRQRLRAEQEPRPVRQAARQPGADPARWSPRPSAGRRRWRTWPRTATRDVELGGKTIRQGRPGGHVVRLGQPRRERDRRARTPTSSTASGRASTCRSASASTAASATAWPRCS